MNCVHCVLLSKREGKMELMDVGPRTRLAGWLGYWGNEEQAD